MRASKEEAEKARQNFAWLADFFPSSISPKAKNAIAQVGEFLNVAKRRLPTEASYTKDALRRKVQK